jgi:hypothetical protein
MADGNLHQAFRRPFQSHGSSHQAVRKSYQGDGRPFQADGRPYQGIILSLDALFYSSDLKSSTFGIRDLFYQSLTK